MGMTIEGAIHEIESELRFQRCDCGTAQLSTGLRNAMKTAINTMHKYQKIKEIYDNWDADYGIPTYTAMCKIGEVLKNGNVD